MRQVIRRALLPVVLASAGAACSYTLSDSDCTTYRDKLHAWAIARASASGASAKRDDEAQKAFLDNCRGTTIPRSTHTCLEQAKTEAAFFTCLE